MAAGSCPEKSASPEATAAACTLLLVTMTSPSRPCARKNPCVSASLCGRNTADVLATMTTTRWGGAGGAADVSTAGCAAAADGAGLAGCALEAEHADSRTAPTTSGASTVRRDKSIVTSTQREARRDASAAMCAHYSTAGSYRRRA